MLEPSNRRLLMESLQPPDGFYLDWAVGTTYSLDLLAMLTAPVAFAFSDWQDRDGKPVSDPLVLLKSVRQYADRICLFCQAGKILVPRAYQPLLANLENSIYQANAPGGGNFHPKLWFLRFIDPEEETVHYRVLCLSRNMTFDRSWDTLLCLDGPLRNRSNAYTKNHPLGRFVEALPGMCLKSLSSIWKKRIEELAYEIRRVEFEVPEPFDDISFWPLGIESNYIDPFPERMDELFVISPFVDDQFLSWFHDDEIPIRLLSREESLGELNPELLQSLENVWILDESANPEPGEAEEEIDPISEDLEIKTKFNDIPLMGLHAKVFVIDQGWYASILTGSANATNAAFNQNVEFMVELLGKKSRCGIQTILGETENGDRNQVSSLGGLLQEYVPFDGEVASDPELEKFERKVDKLAKKLAASAPVAQCQESSEEGLFNITLSPTHELFLDHNEEIQIRSCPISVPRNHLSPVDPFQPAWVAFQSISLLGLTSFFIFDIESIELKVHRQFVLNIPLINAPKHRHETILRDLLKDSSRVLQFLLLLLSDTGARNVGKLFSQKIHEKNSFDYLPSLYGTTLFESLVKTLDKDPARLEQVAQIISDLKNSEKDDDLIPEGLDEIWKPIWSVHQKQLVMKQNSPERIED